MVGKRLIMIIFLSDVILIHLKQIIFSLHLVPSELVITNVATLIYWIFH